MAERQTLPKVSLRDVLNYGCRVIREVLLEVFRHRFIRSSLFFLAALAIGFPVLILGRGRGWALAEWDVNLWTVIAVVSGAVALVLVIASIIAPVRIDKQQRETIEILHNSLHRKDSRLEYVRSRLLRTADMCKGRERHPGHIQVWLHRYGFAGELINDSLKQGRTKARELAAEARPPQKGESLKSDAQVLQFQRRLTRAVEEIAEAIEEKDLSPGFDTESWCKQRLNMFKAEGLEIVEAYEQGGKWHSRRDLWAQQTREWIECFLSREAGNAFMSEKVQSVNQRERTSSYISNIEALVREETLCN